MINKNLDSINDRITDRSNAWYWQIGRNISLEEAMEVWTDKHSGIETDVLLDLVNRNLTVKVAEYQMLMKTLKKI